MIHCRRLVLLAALAAPIVHGQTPPVAGANASADLAAYDVVSVKPLAPNARIIIGVRNTADGIVVESATVFLLMRDAYGGFAKVTTEDSVIGLPDWAKTEYFSLQAKMSPEQAAEFAKLNKDERDQQRTAMLQALLADQFKLKLHHETRQVPDYELTVAKAGPKFTEGDINPNGPKDKDGKPIVGSFMRANGQLGNQLAQAYSMESLAAFLSAPVVGVGRIVKDKTGLSGKYSFALTFAPQLPSAPEPAGEARAPDPRPSIFTALQEQLGLKLVPGTGTVDVLVVDRVERPRLD